jgi:hypothetical protein
MAVNALIFESVSNGKKIATITIMHQDEQMKQGQEIKL